MTQEQLRAELDYWRELEILSGQREHFKPGRTDETAHADARSVDQEQVVRMLADGRITRRLFGSMARQITALPFPTG